MTHYANPALETFSAATQITLTATDCRVHIFAVPDDALQRLRQGAGTS